MKHKPVGAYLASFFFIVLLILFVVCGKTKHNTFLSDSFFAMDTFVSVKAAGGEPNVSDSVKDELKKLERTFSRTDPQSDIARLNAASTLEVTPICAEVLTRVQELAAATEGAFNPCLGSVSALWDITGKKYIPTAKELTALLPYCSADGYTVEGTTVSKAHLQTQIDLGAAVKGYAAEKAIDCLQNKGVTDAMISIGGNIAICGNAPGRTDGWEIGIRNPFFPDQTAVTFVCTDKVIAVSGDYERYFEKDGIRYHHIFDPATGYPAQSGIKSVAVIAPDGLNADVFSTALFVMGVDKALAFYQSGAYDFEAIFFTDDGKVSVTEGLKEQIALVPGAEYRVGVPLTLTAY